jgi:hypothetical protein
MNEPPMIESSEATAGKLAEEARDAGYQAAEVVWRH